MLCHHTALPHFALAKQGLALTLRDATMPLQYGTLRNYALARPHSPVPLHYETVRCQTNPLQCSDPPTLLLICRCSALSSCAIPIRCPDAQCRTLAPTCHSHRAWRYRLPPCRVRQTPANRTDLRRCCATGPCHGGHRSPSTP